MRAKMRVFDKTHYFCGCDAIRSVLHKAKNIRSFALRGDAVRIIWSEDFACAFHKHKKTPSA